MSAANLEKRLQDEIDKRLEERFIFALILVILFDVHYLLESDNFTGPLIVGLLQLVGLILYARRCGIEEIDRLVDKAVHTFKRSGD
ncbi:hypothetical protein [Alcaligenes sp. YSL9]|uniref:hypothetical protein n=1 Tax=Alcaligenes sp. YSL9 TaxID=2939596 RepID=UPI00266D30AF|nr:hypothetical protein [Alcaligenes sp. YSL9]